MIDDAYLRQRLNQVIAATKDAKATASWWVGERAGELQVQDNLKSGRIHWAQAGTTAVHGLEALDRGDREYAELAMRSAESLMAIALATQLEPKEVANLNANAGLRGRPPTTAERNRRLAEAVEHQEREGLKGNVARHAALRADPDLAEAFKGMSDAGIRKALAAGRLLLNREKV